MISGKGAKFQLKHTNNTNYSIFPTTGPEVMKIEMDNDGKDGSVYMDGKIIYKIHFEEDSIILLKAVKKEVNQEKPSKPKKRKKEPKTTSRRNLIY